MRKRFPVLYFSALCLIATGAGAAESDASAIAPWFKHCRQAIVVSASGWDSHEGRLTAWIRESGRWRRTAFQDIPVTLGRNGLGVGVGLHAPDMEGPRKAEGDRRAPAGVFPIELSFGTGPRPEGGTFAYRRTTRHDRWVDDPGSAFYNRWVDPRERGVQPDWDSAEILARRDGLYDLALVVGHNRERFLPGKGSAIFIHRWVRPGVPTIGCTAMDPETLLRIWRWLETERAPLLLQGPGDFLRKLAVPEELVATDGKR